MEFTTSDGFTVLVGRNNRQNDKLTLKTANNNDIWFHTKNIPGSHTVLVTQGRQPTETAMEQAAQLAALHSRAKDSSQVPVDYTQIRHVSKPAGAKPGMVVYVQYKTVFVTPGEPPAPGQ
jgi:predicted ribosome quality control (RQC) complex YloA/Tae2 family protein